MPKKAKSPATTIAILEWLRAGSEPSASPSEPNLTPLLARRRRGKALSAFIRRAMRVSLSVPPRPASSPPRRGHPVRANLGGHRPRAAPAALIFRVPLPALTMTLGIDWNEDVSYDDPRNG